MKKFVLSGVALLALACGHSAGAAEYNWTGFYAGGNAGYAFGRQNSTAKIVDGPGFTTCHFCDIFTGGNDIGVAQNGGAARLHPKGFTGGGQLGVNWQAASWVYGLEADFGAFAQRHTVNNSFGLPANTALIGGGGVCGPTGTTPCTGSYSTTVKTDWLLTIRPRIGYAWDQYLFYATGGLAVAWLNFSQSYNDNIGYPLVAGSTGAGGAESASASAVKTGLIFGGGFELGLAQNWSVKAEYLHTRFNSLTASGRLSDGLTGIFGTFANFTHSTDHLSSHMVRGGLNYKFGVIP